MPTRAAGSAAMRRILITGMSGTGKSTVIEHLGSMGFKAVDLDDGYWCEQTMVPGRPRRRGDGVRPVLA